MGLEELAAHIEIQQVLYRYCRGVDRGDVALLASVYHPDGIDRHGAFSGLGTEFAALLVPRMDQVPTAGQHHITNVLIELNGQVANVESYYIAFHPQATEAGVGHALVCGRYLDRFERRDGVWLIAERQVVIDVSRDLEGSSDWPGAANFPAGRRRQEDPSAALFASREAAA
ncbi:MAG: aromatic-ring-hydroxylating dioxygenase beta subunit [Phenylobacterium sp.]|nr:aromatic-ring-hydroxylating dioxygenase beta subunit [Phenylobacterium sp.]